MEINLFINLIHISILNKNRHYIPNPPCKLTDTEYKMEVHITCKSVASWHIPSPQFPAYCMYNVNAVQSQNNYENGCFEGNTVM